MTAANAATVRCKVTVIGSGPGGAITAAYLAEAGVDVVVLEEGPALMPDAIEPFSVDDLAYRYRNGGLTVALGRPRIQYAEGRCAGGGSEINSGLYHRTPAEILDRWSSRYGVAEIAESDLEPHFAAGERDLCVGLLPTPAQASAASLKLHGGAEALGWRSLEVPRWYKYDRAPGGRGEFGVRQSMSRTYLPRARAAGARLIPYARADRLVRRGNSWEVAVQSTEPGRPARSAVLSDTVFVCAGAIGTAAILGRSAIGENVGRTLRMHPTIKLLARFAEPVNSGGAVGMHQVKEFAPRISLGCSIGSRPYLALALADAGSSLRNHAADAPSMALYYAMITGNSVGSVGVVRGLRDPLIRYDLSRDDLQSLREGLGVLARCLFAAGAVELYPSILGAPSMRTIEEMAALPAELPRNRTSLMTIHLFSTCPMGENRRLCATDSYGRLHGASNIIVSDASLLCTAPGVNPQGSVMAFARRNVLRYLGAG